MLDRVVGDEKSVVFEFRDEGQMRGNPYRNRVAVVFDIRGDRLYGYREHFGSDGQPN